MRIMSYIITWILTTVEWLPFLSIFWLIGAIVFGVLSQTIGTAIMIMPFIFTLLKAWADETRWS